MAHQPATHPLPAEARRTVHSAWSTLLMVYYASSVSWRALKSGALFVLGFFLWSASNILLSYQPTWTFLHYPMAYGFLLVVYGPVHHLVVLPLAIRWRRSRDGRRRRLGKHLPRAGLVAFILAVLLLGTAPVSAMTFQFGATTGPQVVDVNPDLSCAAVAGGTMVHCDLTAAAGVGSVAVESGGHTLTVDRQAPFAVEFRVDRVRTVVGRQQFEVVVRDVAGHVVRRYTRSVDMLPGP